jgi:predicted HAD superfamily Cof-like phosphohydrolase
MTSIEQVKEFHEVFGHPVSNVPYCLPLERTIARTGYMLEELNEYSVAASSKDIVEIADALIDLQYFLDGTLIEHGLWVIKDELFAEVHRSNMTKVCKDENHAAETIEAYQSDDITCYVKKVNQYWVVYRKDNNKVLKAIGWEEPDLKSIIDKYLNND